MPVFAYLAFVAVALLLTDASARVIVRKSATYRACEEETARAVAGAVNRALLAPTAPEWAGANTREVPTSYARNARGEAVGIVAEPERAPAPTTMLRVPVAMYAVADDFAQRARGGKGAYVRRRILLRAVARTADACNAVAYRARLGG